MRDEDKTREELLTDLQRIRLQMARMVEAEAFRRRAERELEQMTEIATALVRNSPCGLLVLQRSHPQRLVLINANPQAARLLGATVQGIHGSEFQDLQPDTALQALQQDLLHALDTGEPFDAPGVTYRNGSMERVLNICAFRLPQDRLGLYLAEGAAHHRSEEKEFREDTGQRHAEPCLAENVQSALRSTQSDSPEDLTAADDNARTGHVAELASQIHELSAQLLVVQESLAQETELRRAAEEGLLNASREVEKCVAARTEELDAARQSLERAVAESHAQEEVLRAARYELEERVKSQESDIKELTETLEIEIEEHKKTEEKLVSARIALESHMTEVDEELEAANELLKEQIAERRRTESELRLSLADRELVIHDLTTQLADATESLEREASREKLVNHAIQLPSVVPAALQKSDLGYVSLDIDGVVKAFNDRLLEIFGLPAGNDPRGINLFDSSLIIETGMLDAVRECFQSRAACTHEGPFPDASGDHRIARVHLAPVLTNGGEITGYEAIFEDVSEDRLKDAHNMRSELVHALGRLTGRVGDVFNTFVQSVSENTQEALTCVESADFSEMVLRLDATLAKARDASRTARRMRQFGRMRPHVETRQCQVFDLTDVVRETLEMDALWSKPAVMAEGHDIVVEPALASGCLIQGVDEDFIELMANLLENAVEALPGGGKIWASTSRDQDRVVLEVRDSGTGIAANRIGNLFEPFQTTKQGHVGLGLCVILGIVRRHGGTLQVHSLDGRGSTFTIRLPYCERPSDETSPANEEPAQGNYRILLIYTLEPVSKMVRNTLARLGYAVFIAQSVQEGVELLKRTKIDAIVCDLAAEYGNAADVSTAVELLHLDMGLRKPPIIVLSEFSDSGPPYRSADFCNLHRIVEKPVSVARLVDIVAEELRDDDANFPRISCERGSATLS